MYEALDYDSEVLECTLYEQRVQLFPIAASTPTPKYKIPVPDRFHLPFNFELPRGLPPSTLLSPGYVFRGRPVGVSYEVCAFVNEVLSPPNLRDNDTAAVLRIVKSSYYPLPDNPPRVGSFAEKTYLGASRPLRVDASLDREVYRVGEPIQVRCVGRQRGTQTISLLMRHRCFAASRSATTAATTCVASGSRPSRSLWRASRMTTAARRTSIALRYMRHRKAFLSASTG